MDDPPERWKEEVIKSAFVLAGAVGFDRFPRPR
jgi:hypothetical protein